MLWTPGSLRQTVLSVFILLAVAMTLSHGLLLAEDQAGDHAEVNGARLWYMAEGEGKPLVLLPGGPGLSHLYFTPHFSPLSDEHQIIYFDPLGRGQSERPTSATEYSIGRDVEDLEGLRQHLDLEKLDLFGHSYGGIVAQAYVLKYPERVGKLILANTLFSSEMYQAAIDNLNHAIQNQHPESWERLLEIRERDQKSSNVEFLMTLMPVATPLAYFFNPSNGSKLSGSPTSFNPEVLFAMAGEDLGFRAGGDLGSFDFTDQLGEVEVPVLILAGRFDRLCFPRYTEQYKTLLPNSTFVMFEQSGHFPFIEESGRFHEVLATFLRQ